MRPMLPRAGTSQAEGLLVVGAEDLVVSCAGHDGFFASGLDAQLRARGIRQLVVGGLAAEVTVSSTVRSANDKGYECLTLTDAFGALDPTTASGELKSITMSGGIFGAIGTTAWLVEELKNLTKRTRQ
jgi:nicotinamidase-related amidase